MKDIIKEMKFEKSAYDFHKYKQYMCSSCNFFIDEVCTKGRIKRICAKKGLKNKD